MITLLTIGQTPRADLVDPFKKADFQQTLNLKGALDELLENEIKRLEGLNEKKVLFVRSRYGTANIGHSYIEHQLQKLIKSYELNSKAIVILCTGEFSCQSENTETILPVQEMKMKMREVNQTKKTVIFIPIEEQCEEALEKWHEIRCEKVIQVVSPGTEQTLQQMSAAIEHHRPDYVLLDCYGYSAELSEQLELMYGCTVHGPQQVAVDRIKQLVEKR